MDAAHRRVDREIRAVQKMLGRVYAKAHKSARADLNTYFDGLKKDSEKLLAAISEADPGPDRRKAETAYKTFFARAVMSTGFAAAATAVAGTMYAANIEAATIMNQRTAAVYTDNYNFTGRGLSREFEEYDFKPITEDEAAKYGEITQQGVNKAKDTAWNHQNVKTAVLTAAFSLMAVPKIVQFAAEMTTRKNQNGGNRQADGILADAENKGRLDGIYRAYDEGFPVQKEWVCVFDNKTRDTHIKYNDLGPFDPEYEYAPGLKRPKDPNCDIPEEVVRCRCGLTWPTGLAKGTTRAAREGIVHGRAHRRASYTGTETIMVEKMTYREWMKWRQSQ